MPPLTVIDCYACNGEGHFASEYGETACTACDATGQIEVCECCFEVPEMLGGYEVCGCVIAAMKQAA